MPSRVIHYDLKLNHNASLECNNNANFKKGEIISLGTILIWISNI